jgi:hypothetical protein
MNGTHRSRGILIAPHETDATALPKRLVDVAPWLLAQMGIGWQVDDGVAGGSASATAARGEYSAEEEALVAERLRVMGYLE